MTGHSMAAAVDDWVGLKIVGGQIGRCGEFFCYECGCLQFCEATLIGMNRPCIGENIG